jgi:F-type H+-transporting ATPase subunit b
MDIVSTVALISINETLLVQLASFLVFVFIFNRVMIRPLRSTMDERDFYLENLEKDIAEADRKAREVTRQMQGQENEVRDSAEHLSREQVEEANRQADRIHEEARKEIDRMRRKTEENLRGQMAEARKHLEAEAETLAAAMMEKALGRRLSP